MHKHNYYFSLKQNKKLYILTSFLIFRKGNRKWYEIGWVKYNSVGILVALKKVTHRKYDDHYHKHHVVPLLQHKFYFQQLGLLHCENFSRKEDTNFLKMNIWETAVVGISM